MVRELEGQRPSVFKATSMSNAVSRFKLFQDRLATGTDGPVLIYDVVFLHSDNTVCRRYPEDALKAGLHGCALSFVAVGSKTGYGVHSYIDK